jgi:hypothetical protein
VTAELTASDAQLRLLFALFRDCGIEDRDERLAYMGRVLAGNVSSSSELTQSEVSN